MGIGPASAVADDSIFLCGAHPLPFILRKCEDIYRLIGDCVRPGSEVEGTLELCPVQEVQIR
jgi:hypothetical protein